MIDQSIARDRPDPATTVRNDRAIVDQIAIVEQQSVLIWLSQVGDDCPGVFKLERRRPVIVLAPLNYESGVVDNQICRIGKPGRGEIELLGRGGYGQRADQRKARQKPRVGAATNLKPRKLEAGDSRQWIADFCQAWPEVIAQAVVATAAIDRSGDQIRQRSPAVFDGNDIVSGAQDQIAVDPAAPAQQD